MISSFKKDFNELQIKKKPKYFKGLSEYLLCIKTKKHPKPKCSCCGNDF